MIVDPNQVRRAGVTHPGTASGSGGGDRGSVSGLRFAFAGRVSTEDLQSPVESRSWQLERASALVASFGEIVADFFDVGQSRATSWLRRPESCRLLEALADPGRGFDAVVVGEPQRVFYDNQYGMVAPLFAHYRVGLWVPELGGPVDPDNEAHGLTMAVFAQLAKAERKRIQIRVRAAMGAKARSEGRFLGGRPPYGYRLADAGPHPNPEMCRMGVRLHRLEPDPVAGPVVTRIFARRAAGLSAAAICLELDRAAIACPSAHDPGRNRHRSGRGWTAGAVFAILRNPRYLGYQVWGRARKTDVLVDPGNVQLGTRPVLVDNPAADWVWSDEQAQPALVDEPTWEKAQQVRCQRAVTTADRTYLLAGLLRCAHCGRRLESAWNNGRPTYRCKHPAQTADSDFDSSSLIRMPKTLSVREDSILRLLPALIIALGLTTAADDDSLEACVSALRECRTPLIYNHNDKTVTANSDDGPIRIRIREKA
ncbi:hypothetical protein GCM10009839_69300 [Catenulispora yoronensis]|uniref:Recombinase domain-containing protein n=1 Tax=Catenulispora yoronensis TaxID=450799 RepID=A0ABP5GQ40_9ACTN